MICKEKKKKIGDDMKVDLGESGSAGGSAEVGWNEHASESQSFTPQFLTPGRRI